MNLKKNKLQKGNLILQTARSKINKHLEEIKINLKFLKIQNEITKPKVLITGSSSGIGYFLAKEFSKINYQVIINGRNKRKLDLAKKNINNCDYILGDMTKINIVKKNIKVT